MAKDIIVTPKATAVYPKLDKPDVYEGEEKKYQVGIKFTDAELKEWKGKAEAFAKENQIKSPKLPFKDIKDVGLVLMAKTGFKPVIFDAKKNKLPEDVIVGNGSIIRVSGSFAFHKSFVTFRLSKVQVITLVKGSSNDRADEFDEEDGFETEGSEFPDEVGTDEGDLDI